MTAAESRQLADLIIGLFGTGDDKGALGRIEQKLDQQDGRIAALERDRIAREAVAAVGTRIDQERAIARRWQITTFIAASGTFVTMVLGLLNATGIVGK